jgi:predicted RNA-binding protein YlxR (DUF448 family)
VGEKHVPIRKCVVTQKRLPKNELARFIYNKDNNLVELDSTGRKNGRGANLEKSLEVFDLAVKSKAFNRVFKTNIENENLRILREEFEKYLKKEYLRNGNSKVTIRIEGDPIKIS